MNVLSVVWCITLDMRNDSGFTTAAVAFHKNVFCESEQLRILQANVIEDDLEESSQKEDIEPEFVSADNGLLSFSSSLEFFEFQSRDIEQTRWDHIELPSINR